MSKKSKIQYIITPMQLAFVNSIIHEETNPENGVGIKKGDAFGKIFIEAHPKFKSFKKSKVARELDGE
jgi:hypothetical protein